MSNFEKLADQELQKYAKRLQQNGLLIEKFLARPMPRGLVKMVDVIPEGKSGNVDIIHFHITPQRASIEAIKAACNNRPFTAMAPGDYVRMVVGGEVMMSDATMEVVTNGDILLEARGDVLIGGLGIGMVVVPLLKNPEVTSVTILERNPHVRLLVEPHLRKYLHKKKLLKTGIALGESFDHKLDIYTGDVFKPRETFKDDPTVVGGNTFDCIYMDIWPSINGDDYPAHQKLRQIWKPYVRDGGWFKCWVETIVKREHKEKRRLRDAIREAKKSGDPAAVQALFNQGEEMVKEAWDEVCRERVGQ